MHATLEEESVVVGLGTIDNDQIIIASLGDVVLIVVRNVLTLQLTNNVVLERDIRSSIFVIDQTIIGNNRNTLSLCLGYNGACGSAISSANNQDTSSLSDH